jgi:hypothetical protein
VPRLWRAPVFGARATPSDEGVVVAISHAAACAGRSRLPRSPPMTPQQRGLFPASEPPHEMAEGVVGGMRELHETDRMRCT